MIRNGVIGMVLLAATVACGLAFAASTDETNVRRELRAWYGKIVDAYEKRDAKAYMARCTRGM